MAHFWRLFAGIVLMTATLRHGDAAVMTTVRPNMALNPYTDRRIRLPMTCGVTPYVENGNVVTTTFNNRSSIEGDQSTYACFDGYIPLGNPTIVCDPDTMQWTAPPICVVTCGAPPVIEAAKVNTTFIGGESQVGFVARYQCNIGLTMISSDTIVCQANGTWSTPPICQFGGLIITACGEPPEIDNGWPATRSYTTTKQTWFDKVTYACDIGFHSEWSDPTITCNTNGTWPVPPKCLPDASCGAAPVVDNGYVLDLDFEAARSIPGSKVQYQCRSGYRLNGTSTIRCQPNLKWSTVPRCNLINCGPPPVVPNAVIYNQSYPASRVAMDGDRVAYACQSGYYIPDGKATIVCLFDGVWTPEPRCVPGFGNATGDGDQVTCGLAPLLSQGSIYNSTFDVTKMSAMADKIYYKCKEGYSLVGREIVVCRPDTLTWTALPQCVK